MKTPMLPKTDSIQELARFWDSHDLMAFEDQLEEVNDAVFEKETDTTLKIDLPCQEAEAVQKLAKTKGVDQEDLIREWILEKLHEE